MHARGPLALLALAVLALAGAACGDDEPDEPDRLERLHVPPGVEAGGDPVPLVVALHGAGGSAETFAEANGLEALADEEGFVVVHPSTAAPDGTSLASWDAGDCCAPATEAGVDDVAYVRDLVASLASVLPIDLDRVYAVGFSNGGMLAYRLACEAADVVAAVGVVAGALAVEGCEPEAPVSALHLHGTADDVVPVDGGPGAQDVVFRSARESAEALAAAQGCDDEPAGSDDEGDDEGDGPATTSTTWSCPDGVEVRLVLVEGMAHEWTTGDGDGPLDATRLLWQFLAAHPRP